MNPKQAFAVIVVVVVVALFGAAIVTQPNVTTSGVLATIAGVIAVSAFLGAFVYDMNRGA